MIKACLCALSFILLSIGAYSQEDRTVDSLLQTRKTDTLGGRVKTYYSPGHQSIAVELQQLVTRAIAYYEKKYSVHFDIHLIVLDSSQWFKEIIPFGFVFCNQNWLVLNAGMSYPEFKSVYGFNGITSQMDSSFSKNKIQAEEIIYSRLKFLCLHELGHYFIYNLSDAQAPDVWTNEFIATYFANEYVAQFDPKIKNGFDIFCRTIIAVYPAQHKTLAEFDSLYFKMKLGNFAWYHSRFYFLADSLYHCSGNAYFNIFQTNFPKKDGLVFNQETIDKLVEANCSGLFSKWNNMSVRIN
jgi:hypothetical protein